MDKVAVILSSYNGEKYIAEQIESILAQKNVSVRLLIRDDGSTDNTLNILKAYSDKYKNVRYYNGKNVGVGISFFALLNCAPEADYYSFADQDDIWFEGKLSTACATLKDNNEPALYTSNQILIDADGKEIGKRYDKEPKHSLVDCIVRNYLSGCTMVMNKALYSILTEKKKRPSGKVLKIRLHDTWVMLAANASGKVYYDPNGYILYRQHADNVVGAENPSGLSGLIKHQRDLWSRKYKGQRSLCAKELLRCFDEYLSQEEKEALQVIAKSDNLFGGLGILRNANVKNAFNEGVPKILIKAMIGWY